MRFNKSAVGDYASHNLSLWYGECPHGCRKRYCYIPKRFNRFAWTKGPLRPNLKAYNQCKYANFDDVDCLVLSFSSDPLPLSPDSNVNNARLKFLLKHLNMLEKRGIKTKVLTKNTWIRKIPQHVTPFKHIQLGMSITTDSGNFQETNYWEPGLPSIDQRLDALDHLWNHGFRTWASMEPLLPKTIIVGAILETIDTNVEEIWVGKGSYDKRLENAFVWGLLARRVKSLKFPQVFLKKELRQFLTKKAYQTVLA